MNPRLRQLLALMFAWYVVSYSGQKIAGPFSLLSDCNEEAQHLAKRYTNVSSICRSFVD